MVRMVDILKKAREKKTLEEKQESIAPESPPVEAPVSAGVEEQEKELEEVRISPVLRKELKVSSEEIQSLYQETISWLKEIFNKKHAAKETTEEIKKIVVLVEKFVDQQSLGNDNILNLLFFSGGEDRRYTHAINVSIISIELGLGLKYEKDKLVKLGAAAILHDIEMIEFSDLHKHTEHLGVIEAYKKITDHSTGFAKIIEKFINIEIPAISAPPPEVKEKAKTNYLYDLIGDPYVYINIIRLAEVYEALTNPPAEREKMHPSDALKEIVNNKKLFRSNLLKILIDRIGPYPVGCYVKLSTGEKGRIIKRKLGYPLRPDIEIIFDVDGKRLKEPKVVALHDHPAVFIKGHVEGRES